jgi:IS605 OrfB family transposase
MKLTFKFKPKLTQKQLSVIEELSFHTTKLFNIANYHCREIEFKNYYELEKMLKNNWHNAYLHSHNYQHCLKMVEQNWKSFFSAVKDYKKNPGKYKATPRPPRYKNTVTRKNEVVFTSLAIRFKGNTLMLSLARALQRKYEVKSLNFEVSKRLQSLVDFSNIQQVRIKWDNTLKQWYFLIIYKTACKEEISGTNIMAVDLGLDNLATLTFKDNPESYIINGRPLKSFNSYINKEIAHLESIRMKQIGSRKFKNTKEIDKLWKYRSNYVNDYLHKASRTIINLAVKHNVGTIVIGDMKNIKQRNKNKSFVQIPVQRLVQMIEYKAQLEGIRVIKVNEAYTSGCSAFDMEKISNKSYNPGRRIQRGLFRTNSGLVVNSDVNGSLNIMRKFLKDRCIPNMIQLLRDNGCVDYPRRIRVA